MTEHNIPQWLRSNEDYKPKRDNVAFIDKSMKATLGLMSSFNLNSKSYKAKEANTSLRLFGILLLVILTAVSHNYAFILFMIALAVVRVATLDGERIRALLKVLLPAIIISTLVLLPSIFLGNPKTPLLVISRILVSVSLVLSLSLTTSFNEITRSLKAFHVPNIIIFILDLTIKYIILLVEICEQMLIALKIRSVGKGKDKASSASGILGTIFLKANDSAELTAQAMECRGFNGQYVPRKQTKIKLIDILYIIVLCAIIGIFAYLEVII